MDMQPTFCIHMYSTLVSIATSREWVKSNGKGVLRIFIKRCAKDNSAKINTNSCCHGISLYNITSSWISLNIVSFMLEAVSFWDCSILCSFKITKQFILKILSYSFRNGVTSVTTCWLIPLNSPVKIRREGLG
jgi:hypothetical protein